MIKKVYLLITLLVTLVFYSQALPPGCSVSVNPHNPSICAGSSVTLTATANPVSSHNVFVWSTGDTANSITKTPGADITYTVTVTDTANGCTATASENVNVNPIPNATVTFNNTPVCQHASVPLAAGGGGTYVWSTGSHNQNITVNPRSTTTYTVTVTKNGCSATASGTVVVNSASLAGLFTNCNAVTVSPYTITLTDASSPSSGNLNYTIIWGDTGVNYSSSTIGTVTHTYGGGAFDLTYIITTGSGCVDTGYFSVRNLTNPALALGSPGNTLGCGPLPLCFPLLNVSNNDATTTYLVNYGDGTPSITYSQPPPDTLCHTYVLPSCGAPGIPNSVFLPNNWFYSITATNYCGTTAGAIGGIQIYTAPVAKFTAPTPVCITNAVTFTNTSTLGYYANCDSSGIFVWYFGDGDSTVVANALTSVTHTYAAMGSYTATLVASNHCGSTSYSQVVCITGPPTAGFILSSNVGCIPFTVSTTNTSTPSGNCDALSYLWTVTYTASPPCGTASNYIYLTGTSTSATPTFEFLTDGTYTITLAVTNICGTVTTTQTVTVKQPPLVTMAGIPSNCSPEVVSPSVTAINCGTQALTYQWSSNPAGLNSTSATPPATTFTTSGPTTIYVSVTNECGTTPDSTSFIVSPLPTVTVPPNDTVCPGTTVPATNFTSNPAGASYIWTNSAPGIGLAASGSGNIPAFSATNTTNGILNATITVTPTSNGCVGVPSTYHIVVYPNPSVSAIANIAICPGVGVVATNFVSVPPGATFTWTNSNTTTGQISGGNGNAPGFTSTNTTTTNIVATISVTATLNGCSGISTNFSVTVYATPTVANPPSNTTVCAGSAVPATTFSSAPTGATYTWTNSNTGIGLAASGNGNVPGFNATNTGTTPITSTIAVTPTLNGCAGTPSTYTITVSGKPTVDPATIPAPSTICPGATVAPTNFATVPPGGTFTWTNNNTNTGLPGSGTGNLPGFTGTNTGTSTITSTITVTPTVAGCAGTPSTITINVSPNPSVNTVTSTTICAGGTEPAVNFTSTPPGATYTWTNSNTSIGLAGSGTGGIGSFVVTDTFRVAITSTITVTPTLNGCTGTSSNYSITVNEQPTFAVIIVNVTVCPTAQVSATSLTSNPPGATYTWTNTNTGIGLAASGSGQVPAFTATNGTTNIISGNITVVPSLGGCAGLAVLYNVAVEPSTATLVPPNVTVCTGNTVAATTLTSNPAGATFTWVNSNTNIGLAASGTGNVPSFVATNGSGSVISGTVTVTASSGSCPGTPASYTITVDPFATVVVPPNQTKCAGALVAATTLTSVPAGATFTWTNSNPAIGLAASGSGNVPAFTTTNSTTAPITGTITVTPSLNGCPSTPASYTITVNPTPTVTVPLSATLCPGVLVVATNFSSTPTGAGFTWTNTNTGIGLAASGSGNVPAFTTTNASAVAITGTITVTPTLNGCPGTPAPYSYIINPTPTMTTPPNQTVCVNATVPASNFVSSPTGATFTWTNNNTAIGLAASGTGNIPAFTATNATNAAIAGTITVTPTLNGCPGNPVTYTIIINPLPVITPPVNDTVCAGALVLSQTFTSVPVGASIAWTNSNTAIGLAASGTVSVPSFTATNSTGSLIFGTITVTPTLNTCVGLPITYVDAVTSAPTITPVTNISVCAGTSVPASAFASTPAGATFSWTNNNASIGLATSGTGNTPVFTATNATTAAIVGTITVTATSGCPGPPITYTITVTPPPTVTVPVNQSKCPGVTIAATTLVTVPAGGTYTWTNSNINIGLAASGVGQVPGFTTTNPGNAAISGTITISPTVNGCVGTPASYVITVNPLPTVTVPVSDTVCPISLVVGTSFTSVPPGATYTWTNTNPLIGLGASGNGNVPPFASSNATTAPIVGTIKVTPTLAGCPGAPVSYNITVNPTPTVTLPASSSVCAGATVAATNFTSTPVGATFTWTNSNPIIGLAVSGTGNLPAFTAVNPGISNQVATITVTPTLNGCPGTSSFYTITVKPLPIFEPSSNDTICAGTVVPSNILVSIPAGATYSWVNTNTLIGLPASGTGNIPQFTATNNTGATISGNVTVTTTLNGCPAAPSTFNIAVEISPVVTVPANAAYCNGATVPGTALTSTIPGTSYTWTNSNNSIGLGASGVGDLPSFTATNTSNAAIVGTITVTPINGCTGPNASYTITVNPPPTANVPANITTCPGSTVGATNFTSVPTGATYAWTNSNPAIGLAASGVGNVPAFVAVNATGAQVTATITVTPTLNGCPGTPSTYTIAVNPLPVVSPIVNDSLCPGSVYTAPTFTTTPTGATYTWTNTTTLIGLAASGTGNLPNFTATNTSAAMIVGTIKVTPTLTGCVGAPYSYTISVFPAPTTTVPGPQSVCVGGTVAAANFTSNPVGATFAWSNTNTNIGLGASGTGNIAAYTSTNATLAPISGTVSVTATLNGCVGNPATYTITVKPVPTVILPVSDTLCPGTLVPITSFISSPTGSTFAWTNSNTAIGAGASGAGNVPAFSATNATLAQITGIITVTPTLNGCPGTPGTYSHTVNPVPNVTVPANIIVCNGATIAATTFTSNIVGTTYNWTNSNNAIGLAGSGTGNVPSFTATNTGTAAISGTIIVTPFNVCTGANSSYTITVNPPPVVTVPATITVCSGVTIGATALSSVPAGATYAWTNSNPAIGLAASGVGNVPAFIATNATTAQISATITITPTLNTCPGTPSSYVINVNPLPTVTVPVSDTVCPGVSEPATSFISTPPGASFNWTNTNTSIGLPASGIGNVISFTSTNASAGLIVGTIKVTASLAGCTGPIAQYNKSVYPLPAITAPANVSVCPNVVVPITNFTSTPVGATFAWTNNNTATGLASATGAGSVPSFTSTNATNASIIGNVVITATLNGCIGNSVGYSITVKPTPTVTVPVSDTLCPGTVEPITAFTSNPAGATFAWTNTNTLIGLGASGAGNVPAFTAANATAAAIIGNITVTPTLNACAGLPVIYSHTVNPKPVVTVPSSYTACPGISEPIGNFSSNPAGAFFTWSNSNINIGLAASGIDSVPAFTTTNPGSTTISGTITCTPSLKGCIGSPVGYTISVSPSPVVTVPANFSKCTNVVVAATTFSSTPAGATYAWTSSNTTIGLAASGVGNVPSFTTLNGTSSTIIDIITVTPTLNGCVGLPATYTITVVPAPVITPVPNDTVCYGTPIASVAFSSTPPGSTYAWTNNNSAIGLATSGAGSVPGFTATNASNAVIKGTITVTPTLNTCLGPATTYVVVVNPAPLVTVPASFTVCPGTIVTAANFTSTPVGATYTWTNSNPAIGLSANGIGNVPAFSAFNNSAVAVVGTITVTPTLNGCLGTPVSYTITVKPAPVVTVPANDTVCDGNLVPATAFTSVPTGATFAWTNSNTTIGVGASGTGNVVAFTGSNITTAPSVGTFTVTPTLNGCSGLPATYTVTVNPIPVVTVPSNITVCQAVVVPASNFTSTPPGTTYTWTNSNIGIGLPSTGSGNVPAFTAADPRTTPVTATIIVTPSINGCPGSPADYTITVKPIASVAANPSVDTLCSATLLYVTLTPSIAGTSISWTTNSPAGVGGEAAGTGDSIQQVLTNGGATPQTVIYTVISNLNGCNGLPDTLKVVVNPGVQLTFSQGIQTICTGGTTQTVNITSSLTTPINWVSNANGVTGVIASGSDSIPSQTLVNNTNLPIVVNYNISAGFPGCPDATSTYDVIVNPSGTPLQQANQVICSGSASQPIIIDSSALGVNYAWTATSPDGITGFLAADTSAIIASQTFNNPNTTAGIVIYTISPGLSACSGVPVYDTITVNPAPVVSSVTSQTICSGSSSAVITPVANIPGTTINWSLIYNGSVTGAAVTGTGNIPAQVLTNLGSTDSLIYSIASSFNGCYGPLVDADVVVTPSPNVQLPAVQTICTGTATDSVILLSNAAGATFSWTAVGSAGITGFAASGNGNLPVDTLINIGSTPGTLTYTITASANGCVGPPATYTITINPVPVAVTAPDTICSSAQTNVAITSNVTGTTFTWVVTAPGTITGASNGSGTTIQQILSSTSPTAQTVVYVITPTANGCVGANDTANVVVNPGTTIAFSIPNQTICSGTSTQSVQITGSTPGASYSWTSQSSGVTGVLASGADSIPAQTLVNTTAFPLSVIYTVSTGAGTCPSNPANYEVIVNPTPQVIVPPATTTCSGVASSVIFITSNIAGTTFSWTGNSPNGVTGYIASDTSDVIPSMNLINSSTNAEMVIYTITPGSIGCPGIAVNDTINVEPTPIIDPIADQTICSGGTSTAITPTSALAGTTFNWTLVYNGNVTGASPSGTGTIPAQTLTNNGTTTDSVEYNITPTANGCNGPAIHVSIIVSPSPDVILPAAQQICSGATSNAVTITSDATGATFSWTATATGGVTGFTASGTGDIPAQTLINTGTVSGTVTYVITPTANGCPGTPVNYTITVNPIPVAIASPDTICSAATTAIAITSNITGTTFTWTATPSVDITGSSNGSGNNIQQILNNAGAAAEKVLFIITPTAQGCVGPVDSVDVVVNPGSTIAFSIPNQTICSGQSTQSVQITGTPPGGTYAWTSQSGGLTGVAVSGSDSIPVQTLVNSTAFPLSVVYTVSIGAGSCPSAPANYEIIVNPTPQVILPPADTICSGLPSPIIFISSNINGTTFTWTGASPDGVTGFTASGNTDVIPSTTLTNPSTTTGMVIYTVTPGSTGCPGIAVNDTVFVDPSPVADPLPTQTICSAGTSTAITPTSALPGTTFAWTLIYNGNITGATANGTGTIPAQTLTNNGNHIDSVVFNVVPTNNGCAGPAINVSIVVSPSPDVILPANQTLCSGATSNIVNITSDAAGATFSWTATATAGVTGFTASGNGNLPAQTLVNSGIVTGTVTYVITPTANGCPGSPVNYTITVTPVPVAVTAPDTICSANQTNVAITSNIAGSAFSWTFVEPAGVTGATNGNGAVIQQILSNSNPVADSVLYLITPTAGGCVGSVDSAYVMINPGTAIQFSIPNQTICSGQSTQSVQITGTTPGGTYPWTSQTGSVTGVAASGTDSIPVQTLVNTTSLPLEVVYTVTAGGGTCPSNPANYEIIVNPAPIVTVPPAQTICSGTASSVIFISSNIVGTTYTWTGASPDGVTGFVASGNTNVISSSILTNPLATAGMVIYTITPGSTGCPGVAVNDTINVEPIPIITPIADQTICSGATSTVITPVSDLAGTTFSWTLIYNGNVIGYSASGTGSIPAQTLTNNSLTFDSVEFNITPTDNGCVGPPVTATIVVTPVPDVILPAGQQICSGATSNAVTINSDAAGATFSWTATATGVVTGFTATGTGNIPVQTLTNGGTTAGTVTYAITPSANGCPGPIVNYAITVNPLPVAATVPDTICSGTQTNIVITSNLGGTTFTWTTVSPVGLTGAANGSGSDIQQVLTNGNAVSDSVLYIITPTANGCVGPLDTAYVIVNPGSSIQFSIPNQTICSGATTQPVTITGTLPGGTYPWTSAANGVTGVTASGTDVIPAQTLVNTSAFPVAVIYSVNTTASGCSSSPANYEVIVDPVPVVTPVPAQTVCSGLASQIIALNSSVSGTTFSWTGASPNGVTGFSASGTSTSTIPSTVLTNPATTAGIVVYTVTGTAAGCPGASVNDTINVEPVPVISPIPTQSICSGATNTLATPVASIVGTTFSWNVIYSGQVSGYTANGTGNIPSQTLNNASPSLDSVVFAVTPSVGGCPGAVVDFVIEVTSPPNVILPNPQTICSGASTVVATLTSNAAGATFGWTASGTAGLTGFTTSGNGDIPVQTITNTGNTSGTVTYVITPTANGCVGPPVNYLITVNPLPQATATPSPDTICPSSQTNIAITSTIPGTTFSWTATEPAGVTGAVNGTGSNIQQTLSNSTGTAQTVVYVITPTAGGCVGPDSTVNVVVNTGADIQFTPTSQTICSGQNTQAVTITSSLSGVSFVWTSQANGVTGVTANGTSTIPVQTLVNPTNFAATVNYNVSAAFGTCPNATATYSIVVDPVPTVATAATQTVCSGQASQANILSSTQSSTTFSWTASSPDGVTGYTASGNTSVIPSQTLSNTGTTQGMVIYVVTPGSTGCQGAAINDTILVNPIPVIDPLVPQSICSGNTSVAVNPTSAIAGAVFNWTVIYNGNITGYTTSGTGTIPAQTLFNNAVTADSVVFGITPVNGGCTGPLVDYSIVVNPGSDVILPASQTICSASSTSIVNLSSDAVGATFSWTATATPNVTGFTASGTGNIPAQTLTNSGTTAGTVTYAVSSSANGCTGIAYNYSVTVKPEPVVTALPSPETICSNTQTNIALTSTIANTTFSWTVTAPADVFGATSGTGNAIQQVLVSNDVVPQTVVYSVTPSSIGCPGTPVPVNVIVNPVANVLFTPAPQSVCSGQPTQLVTINSATAGATFTWTSQANGATGIAASGTNTIPVQTPGNSGAGYDTAVFTAVASYAGCPGLSADYDIVVNPVPTVTLPATQTVCAGVATNPVALASPTTGATFAWTGSSPDGVTGFTATGTGSPIPAQTLANTSTTAGTVIFAVTASANGCSGPSSNYTITVNPAPVVILPQPQTICSGTAFTAVTLTSNIAGTTYTWTSSADAFITGNTASGTGDISSQTLNNSGSVVDTVTYTVVSSANACPGISSDYYVIVNPLPTVIFTPQPQTICSGQTSQLVALTSNTPGVSIVWNATVPNGITGAATTGTNTIPAQTLTNSLVGALPQPLTITYVAVATTSGAGCPGSPANYTITVQPVPVISFAQTVSNGCSPLSVDFMASTQNYGIPDTLVYNWGDGSANTTVYPSAVAPEWYPVTHSFYNNSAAPITFTISLVAHSQCVDTTVTATVTVLPNSVSAFFTAQPANGCAPLTVTLHDQSTGPGTLSWCLNYNRSTDSCMGVGRVDTAGTTFDYTFTAGTYTIALFAQSGFGCGYDSAFQTITVAPSPVAAFTYSNDLCAITPVQFNNHSTVPPGTSVTEYNWNFGDGDSSLTTNPVYTYDSSGNYNACLTVTTNTGCSNTICQPVTVLYKPVATFTNTDTCANSQPTVFTNGSVGATTYAWDFGDGNTSVLPDPSHNYGVAGSYQVTLISYTSACSDTFVKPVVVYPVPVAAFTAPGPYTCGVPASLPITNNSTGAISFAWDFGNGTSSTNNDPIATYGTPGNYTITLAASNHLGCVDTARAPVQIYALPMLDSATITPSQGCQPVFVEFAVQASNANTYVWNYGDGSPTYTGNGATSHTYTDTGTYDITVIMQSFGTCIDTFKLPTNVTVHPIPTADFEYTMNTTIDSALGNVQFINTSSNGETYQWSFGDGEGSALVNPVHDYAGISHFDVELVATNQFGCVDSINKSVYVIKKSLYVPNAFAPEYSAGNALVKEWKPSGMGLITYHAQVFDKWGELMWESSAITNDEMQSPAEGWDGTYQGKICQQDVYVWKVEAVFMDGTLWKGMSYKFQPEKKTIGSVTLIR